MSTKIKMEDKFIEGTVMPIVNRPVKWAALVTPDTKYESCWKMDIILTEEMATNLKAAGFACKQDNDGDWILRAKKKTHKKNGEAMSPPRVVGADGQTAFTEMLGNGTICNVNLFCKYVEVNGKTYLPARLNEVQVVKHVVYAGASPGFAPIEETPAGTGDDVPF